MRRTPAIKDRLLRSVAPALAYFALCKAVRRNPRVRSDRQWLVVLHAHQDEDIAIVERAARFYLRGNGRSRTNEFAREDDVISVDSKPSFRLEDGTLKVPRENIHYRKLFLVCGPDERPSPELVLAADAFIRLEPTNESHIRTVLRLSRRSVPSARQLAVVLSNDLATIDLAFRGDRTLVEAVSRLEAMPSKEPQTYPGRNLDQIHGMGEAGVWGRQLAEEIEAWKQGELPWSAIDSAILLSGPPGTGKTSFATGLANSCAATLVIGSYGRWQAEGHLGDCLAAMRDSFSTAIKNAPAVLFIDEIDAFGSRKTSSSDNAEYNNKVIAALLEHLDGVEGREGVVVLAACNHPEMLDPALLRAGRLDLHVRIPLPDITARAAILKDLFENRLEIELLRKVAARTHGWTGADLTALARQAKRRARQERREASIADLEASLPRLVELPQDDLYRTAVHEAGHALVSIGLKWAEVMSISVISHRELKAGSQTAGETTYKPGLPTILTRSEGLKRLAVLLGGAAAEELVFGERSELYSAGEGSDLESAIAVAKSIETLSLGKGSAFALPAPSGGDASLDAQGRMERLLGEAYALALQTLRDDAMALKAMSVHLTSKKYLGQKEILDVTRQN
ncbi:AAA family ATPase [Aliihoeflea aestuarii]|jgi:cell division protease FtsH|uniref:AAA family ATPase n=1 Tax=Aliihoeflea aestuarii TaxID=453840 RepID=UPI00209509FA|nr:AAA family ATPase [Aliihoeflea aestuarii]MCO6393263.1 AAA family ATPase [Aliihoeflea aestuarii]